MVSSTFGSRRASIELENIDLDDESHMYDGADELFAEMDTIGRGFLDREMLREFLREFDYFEKEVMCLLFTFFCLDPFWLSLFLCVFAQTSLPIRRSHDLLDFFSPVLSPAHPPIYPLLPLST